MSGVVRRYSSRTYDRTYRGIVQPSAKDDAANQAFDDILGNKAIPIKAAPTKWGKTSFSRVREDEDSDTKRVKLDGECNDPFSFESDDDRSPRKPVTAANPPEQFYAAMEPLEFDTEVVESQQSDVSGFKKPLRTYTRSQALEQNVDKDDTQPPFSDIVAETEDRKTEFLSSPDVLQQTSSEDSYNSGSQQIKEEPEEDIKFNIRPMKTYGGNIITVPEESDDDATVASNLQAKPKSFRLSPLPIYEGLTFRSAYLNPDVYRNFKKSPRKDPVGNLNNSTVVHKSEVKHNRGTTLIVVCSPKDISEQKKTGVQTKYFKDSAKDIKRVTRSSSAERSTQNTLDSSNSDMIESEAKEEDSNIADEKMEEDITESPEIHKSLAVDEASEDDQFPQCHSQEVTEPELLESSDQENRNQDTGSIDTLNNLPDSPVDDFPEKSSTIQSQPEKKEVKANTSVRYHRIFRSRNKNVASDLEPVSELLDEGTEKNYTEDEVIEKQPQVYISEVKIEDNDSEMTNPQEFTVMEEDSDSMQNTPSSVTSGEEEYQLSPASDMANKKEFQQRYGKQTKQMERKIFRSKTGKSILTSEQKKIFQSPKKSQAVYNVRSWQSEMDEEDNEHDSRKSETQTHPPKLKPVKKTIPKFEDVPKRPPKLTRAVHWPTKVGDEAYTSVHVAKDQKELYTVVRNVKQAYEVQEIGETQEYDDDVEYLLHGLQEAEPITTRCLSCIGLAQKCILASFRMHLRAHGTVTQIFSHLQDAPSDPSLALCTSLLLFMLSRDRLNIDLDHQTLNLMLRLLGIDNQEDTNLTTAPAALRALNRNKEKVRETYDLLKKHMGSKLPELESISTGNLAMESLLSLTSKEAGEWFKEELRGRGALDHIVDTVCSCVEAVKDEKLLTDSAIEYLKKVDRCLRVLENVSYTNEDNQSYLISYKSGTLIVALTRALRTCEDCLSVYPLDKFSDMGKVDKESTGWVLYSCILAVLRVLLNLTHENAFGSTRCGQQDDLIQLILISILHTPQFISLDHRFDMLVLGLGLLINMVEHCEVNRRRLIETNTSASYESLLYGQEMKALQALVEVFYHRIEAAARLEEQDLGSASTPDNSFNKSGEWKESDSGMEWVINSAVKQKPTTEKEEKPGPSVRESTPENGELQDEETFTKALHRAGKHMENSIVAAYLALLLGCVIQDNRDFTEEVQQYLHEKSFGEMIRILKKFLGFMNLTTGVGSSGGKSIAHVIEVLETC